MNANPALRVVAVFRKKNTEIVNTITHEPELKKNKKGIGLAFRSDWKNMTDQTHSCPRGYRHHGGENSGPPASWGKKFRAPLTPAYITALSYLGVQGGALSMGPILPRDAGGYNCFRRFGRGLGQDL